jgi:phosphoglucosamine mutase
MKYFGTSGIRAIYDENLLILALKAGLAVGRRHDNVVVATDTRTSGDAMKSAVTAGLLSGGCRCQDAGVAPTPTLGYITREFDAGVMITASHNPPEYNGIKLLNPDGSSFTSMQQAQIEEEILSGKCSTVPWDKIYSSGIYRNAVQNHIDRIAADFPSALNLKVVVDAGCGAASEVTPQMLARLGCNVIPLNCYHSGFFPRPAEPTEANLQDLCRAVRESGAALGIAHDGDADRMMAVDDRGRFIPGDKLLAIFAQAISAEEVITTLDASMSIEEMGFNVRRTPVGDTCVSEELRNGGDFGGETSGSWIFPEVSLCPDGVYAAARLAAIAGQQSLAELVDSVPAYPLLRGSIPSDGMVISNLETELTVLNPIEVDNTDGTRLSFDDGWLLVRPSGTEPKIRLTVEAKSSGRARELYDSALRIIEESKKAREKVN